MCGLPTGHFAAPISLSDPRCHRLKQEQGLAHWLRQDGWGLGKAHNAPGGCLAHLGHWQKCRIQSSASPAKRSEVEANVKARLSHAILVEGERFPVITGLTWVALLYGSGSVEGSTRCSGDKRHLMPPGFHRPSRRDRLCPFVPGWEAYPGG